MDKNPPLRTWLEAFIEEKIRNGKSFAIENDLTALGKELFREKLQKHIPELEKFFSESGNEREYLKILNGIIFGFEKTLSKSAAEIVELYSSYGFCVDDFSYKKTGVAGFLEKTAAGAIPDSIGAHVLKAAENSEAWASRSGKKYADIVRLAEEKLRPRLLKLLDFYDQGSINYFTAKGIVVEWFTASVLIDLNEEVARLCRERSLLPLAGSNMLLKGIIDGNDTPFIYEKAGNTWLHFMIDEFQDTSEMQWDNFRPLIANSLGLGYGSVMVGDVKQSIYRWRNSNWNILDNQIYHDFQGFKIRDVSLNANFRSQKEIVDFNNAFFPLLVSNMADYEDLQPALNLFVSRFRSIYGDVRQDFKNKSGDTGGYVGIDILDNRDNDFAGLTLCRLVEQVRELFDRGFSAGDIAILVRRKDEGTLIVRHFLKAAAQEENKGYNLKVISGESLFLKSSAAVNFVVTLFRYFSGGNDPLTRTLLLFLYKNYVEQDIPVPGSESGYAPSEKNAWFPVEDPDTVFNRVLAPLIKVIWQQSVTSSIDEMITRICHHFRLFELRSELPFLHSLIDKAMEIRKNGVNDASTFLKWWEEKGEEITVNVDEGADAIRLLTLHKSKGLEFNAVLLPFADWRVVEYSSKDILWCEPDKEPFNKAPLVPVNFTRKLNRTIFADDYYRELFNVLVDNLNLVYVAFTRAESVLWVNLPAVTNRDRVGSFIGKTIHEVEQLEGFENSFNAADNRFSYGRIPQLTEKNEFPARMGSDKWHYREFAGKLKLKTDSDDFLQLTAEGITRKNLGKAVHSILSEIITVDDFETAWKKAMAWGLLNPDEVESVREQIHCMMNHPLAKDWFTGNWKVIAETELITPEAILRPDRIMVSNNHAVVVDFKSGETRQEYHVKQVWKYAEILRETGFQPVTGYLWYIRSNELVEICNLQ